MNAARSAGFAGVERQSLLATPCQRAPFRHAFLARLIEALEDEVEAGLLRTQATRIFDRVVFLLSPIRGTQKCMRSVLPPPPPWALVPS